METEAPKCICRFCLEVTPIVYSVFNEDLHKIVENFTSLTITDSDDLPKEVCSKCITNIYFVDNIRSKFIEAHNKLQEIHQQHGNFQILLTEAQIATSLKLSDISPVKIKQEEPDREYMINIIEVEEPKSHSPKKKLNKTRKKRQTSPKVLKKEMDEENVADDEFEDEMNNLDTIIYPKTDQEPFVYHCKLCNVDLNGSREYRNHKAKHTKRMCKECGVTIRRDNFRKHTLIHSLGKQICDICGSEHKSFESLRTHNFHFHKNNKKEYKCEECNLTFKYRHRWNHHNRKVHTGDRPYQCDQCGKKFFTLETIKRHVDLVHLKLRDFMCKYCNKGYSTRYALMVHTRQHTNETPYACEICGEGFRQNVSLRTHKKSKHGIVDAKKDVPSDGVKV